jgi:hypothetical protein
LQKAADEMRFESEEDTALRNIDKLNGNVRRAATNAIDDGALAAVTSMWSTVESVGNDAANDRT